MMKEDTPAREAERQQLLQRISLLTDEFQTEQLDRTHSRAIILLSLTEAMAQTIRMKGFVCVNEFERRIRIFLEVVRNKLINFSRTEEERAMLEGAVLKNFAEAYMKLQSDILQETGAPRSQLHGDLIVQIAMRRAL